MPRPLAWVSAFTKCKSDLSRLSQANMNIHFPTLRTFAAFAVLAALFLVVTPALAKRSAPKPVAAVIADVIEYSAPSELMGFVVATDTRTHKELWRERIYKAAINPALEGDVQDVFITSLVIERGALIITNERGENYSLDLATRKVIKRQ